MFAMTDNTFDRPDWNPGEHPEAVLELLERRRLAIDQVMWQTPALVVAAQAFLFNVALNPGTPPWARVAVMTAGFVAVVAASHSLAKQRYLEVLHSQAIKRCLARLGYPGVYRDDLAELWEKRGNAGRFWDLEKRLSKERHERWIVTRPSYELWLVAFIGFAIVDLIILGDALAR